MKKKDILMYLSSFGFLVVSFVFFIFAFWYQNRMAYYIGAAITLALFCTINRITAKKITRPDGYNMVQAYFFYEKCIKAGVEKKSDRLNQKELLLVKEIAESYDYCEGFDDDKCRKLYADGYEAKKLLRK